MHTDSHVSERRESMWVLTISPGIWAAHFMLCYVAAAIWCAKAPTPLAALGTIRTLVVLLTALALGGIALTGWIGYRAHSYGSASLPHDDDTPEDRHRFLGYATVLLSGLSAVAVVYAALVIVFVRTCE
jgi:hypothetical protein